MNWLDGPFWLILNKTDNPFFGEILKRAFVNVMFGAEYASLLERKAEKVGVDPVAYNPEPMRHRHWIGAKGVGTVHNVYEQTYLEYHAGPNRPTVRFETLAGEVVSYDEVKPYLVKSEAKKQMEHAETVLEQFPKNEPVTEPEYRAAQKLMRSLQAGEVVIRRGVMVENVVSLTLDGDTFPVEIDEQEAARVAILRAAHEVAQKERAKEKAKAKREAAKAARQ